MRGNAVFRAFRFRWLSQPPWCTLGTAASNVQPGDTVTIRAGTYAEKHTCPSCDDTAVLQLVTPGTPSAWIRFRGSSGEHVVLSGSAGATTGILSRLGASYTEIDGVAWRAARYAGV